MDEFRERIARIFGFIKVWCEFGLLLWYTALMIPVFICIGIGLLVLPIVYLIYAVHQPLLTALYLLAVVVVVLAYMYFRNNTTGDEEDPHVGRPIISEGTAVRKSKSLINPDSKSTKE